MDAEAPAQPTISPEAEAPKPRQTAKTKASAKTASSRLRREERGERLSVYLPPELVTALRIRCAEERRSMSDALTDAVEAWVKSSKKRAP